MSDTPSQQIIKQAQQSEYLTDRIGRKLEVKPLAGREISKLLRACGAAASNEVWRDSTLARAALRSINDVPLPFPQNLDDLDGLWERVDNDAADALLQWVEQKAAGGNALNDAGESSAPQA